MLVAALACTPDKHPTAASASSPTPDSGNVVGTAAPTTAADTLAPAVAPKPDTSFTFAPPAPEGGKLLGVVELGASGLNSFIVRIDGKRRWRLEKSEYGNSLLLEGLTTQDDLQRGVRAYVGEMLDYGVSTRDIHFVASSGAAKAANTTRLTAYLKTLGYPVVTVSAAQEGSFGLLAALPPSYAEKAFVVDIGSGNTKISWKSGDGFQSVETFGAKYYQTRVADTVVAGDVRKIARQVPEARRSVCFLLGGVPYELAKQNRREKERYTLLKAPTTYTLTGAKNQAGITIYSAVADATGCQRFVFDWDANFTIGYLLSLQK